jgi:hypothetical protein
MFAYLLSFAEVGLYMMHKKYKEQHKSTTHNNYSATTMSFTNDTRDFR